MNLKKFISGVSALTIAASAFAGMAVTASAADSAVAYTNTDASGKAQYTWDIAQTFANDSVQIGFKEDTDNDITAHNVNYGLNAINGTRYELPNSAPSTGILRISGTSGTDNTITSAGVTIKPSDGSLAIWAPVAGTVTVYGQYLSNSRINMDGVSGSTKSMSGSFYSFEANENSKVGIWCQKNSTTITAIIFTPSGYSISGVNLKNIDSDTPSGGLANAYPNAPSFALHITNGAIDTTSPFVQVSKNQLHEQLVVTSYKSGNYVNNKGLRIASTSQINYVPLKNCEINFTYAENAGTSTFSVGNYGGSASKVSDFSGSSGTITYDATSGQRHVWYGGSSSTHKFYLSEFYVYPETRVTATNIGGFADDEGDNTATAFSATANVTGTIYGVKVTSDNTTKTLTNAEDGSDSTTISASDVVIGIIVNGINDENATAVIKIR